MADKHLVIDFAGSIGSPVVGQSRDHSGSIRLLDSFFSGRQRSIAHPVAEIGRTSRALLDA